MTLDSIIVSDVHQLHTSVNERLSYSDEQTQHYVSFELGESNNYTNENLK